MAPTITVEIDGNSAKLRQEMSKAGGSVMDFGRELKGIAGSLGIAFGVGAVVNFAKESLSAADAVVTYAKGIGETVKAVVALTKAATESGVPQEKMLNWLQRVVDAQETIARGGAGSPLAKSLESIGVNVEAFINLKPAEAFMALTKAAQDSGQGVSVLSDVLGKMSASDALDVKGIIDAAGGFDKYAASVDKATDATKRLADQQDRLDRFTANLKETVTRTMGFGLELAERFNKALGLKEGNLIGNALVASPLGLLGMLLPGSGGAGGAGSGAPGSPPRMLQPPAAGKPGKTEEDFREAAQARLAAYDLDQRFRAEMGGMSEQQMRDRIKMGRNYIANPRFGGEADTTVELRRIQALESELASREKERNDNREKWAADQRRLAAEAVEIGNRASKAAQGITVDVSAPNAIQRMGGMLGGRGGYEFSIAERQAKLAEIQAEYQKAIAENTKETNRKLAEG